MKTILGKFVQPALAAGVLGLGAPISAQEPAFEGTLADYLALDEDGVRLGGAVFSDFRLLPLQQGASGLRSDFIGVVPLTGSDGPGFRFEIMDGATAPDFFELRFSFRVTGVAVDRATLSLDTANVRSDSNGGVDTIIDLAATGDAPGSLATLIAFASTGNIGDLTRSAEFPPVEDLSIEFDTVIDGGGEGRPGEITASLGSVSLDLREVETPEIAPRITDVGLIGDSTYFIEFTSAPSAAHVVTSSPDPASGFGSVVALSGGSGTTDAGGFGRVEFDISDFGDRRFFRLEAGS